MNSISFTEALNEIAAKIASLVPAVTYLHQHRASIQNQLHQIHVSFFSFLLLFFLRKFVFYLPQSMKCFRSAFDRMFIWLPTFRRIIYLYFLVLVSLNEHRFRASSGNFWFSLAKNKRLHDSNGSALILVLKRTLNA